MSLVVLFDPSAITNPNYGNDGEDDGFLDIDDFLTGLQQESTSAIVNPNAGGVAGKIDDETRDDSPIDSSRSTVGSTQGEQYSVSQLGRDYSLIPSCGSSLAPFSAKIKSARIECK